MIKIKEDLKRYNAMSLTLLACLALAAGALLAKSLAEVASAGVRPLLVWLVFALVLAITSARYTIPFPGTRSNISISEALTFLTILVLSPYHGVLLAVVDMILVSRRLKISPSLYLFNTSNHTVSIYVAGQVYYLANIYLNSQDLTRGKGQQIILFAAPLIAMALTHYAIHIAAVALMSHLAFRAGILNSLCETLPWEPVTFLAGATAAGLLNYVFQSHGYAAAAATLALVLPIPIIVYYTFKTYQDKIGEKGHHYQKLSDVYDSVLEMMAMAIDSIDDTTHDHIRRIRLFAVRMGELAGLPELEIEALKAGALLHDIGKIGIPAYILNKPGKLTPHEFEQMKLHTIIGADMLADIDFHYPVVPIVRHHHERWDGQGYPDGLKGEEIPITARILTLVDNYDAMRSDRPYHKAMSSEAALAYIRDNSGIIFDPSLVDKFLSVASELEREAAYNKERSDHRQALMPETQTSRASAALSSIAGTNQRVTGLLEMSRSLAGVLPVEDVVAILADRLEKLVPFTTCAISLFDPAKAEFEVAHAAGLHSNKFIRRRQSLEVGITGWVIANQRPMFNTNPALDLGFLGSELASEYKAGIVFPLVRNDESLGAIALYSTEMESYGAEYVHLIESVSQPASEAIHKAMIFDEVQQSAFTDMATGVSSFRLFSLQFDREMARCERSGAPLSLILLSIKVPGNKQMDAGNWQALASLGRLIAEQTREIDMVARHPDDSFIVLLPDSGRAEARNMQTRISKAISKLIREQGLTVALGTATRPDDGSTLEELLQIARSDSTDNAFAIHI